MSILSELNVAYELDLQFYEKAWAEEYESYINALEFLREQVAYPELFTMPTEEEVKEVTGALSLLKQAVTPDKTLKLIPQHSQIAITYDDKTHLIEVQPEEYIEAEVFLNRDVPFNDRRLIYFASKIESHALTIETTEDYSSETFLFSTLPKQISIYNLTKDHYQDVLPFKIAVAIR